MIRTNKYFRFFLFWIIIACFEAKVSAQNRDNLNKYIFNESPATGKPVIDFNTLSTGNEQPGDFAAISRDGHYCSYVIDGPQKYTIIQATDSDWRHKLAGERVGFFSGNSRYYIYQSDDSLCFLTLGEGVHTVIKNVASYKLPDDDNRNEWMAVETKNKTVLLKNMITGKEQKFAGISYYNFINGDWFSCQLDNPARELFTVQLSTGKIRNYEHVTAHRFDRINRVLILQTEHEGLRNLQWVDPVSGRMALVWTVNVNDSSHIENYAIDKASQRLVFMVHKGSFVNRSVWYYRKGMNKAVQKVLHDAENKTVGMELTGAPVFSDDGRYIIVSMSESTMDKRKLQAEAALVNVWNYRDTFLMSAQVTGTGPGLNEWLGKETYMFSIPTEGEGEASYLSGAHETLFLAGGKEYAAINKQIITDRFWEDWAKPEIAIVSLRNGKRINLRKGIDPQFSPDGTWLLCYDNKTGQYFRYNINSKQYTDLSAGGATYFGEENEFSDTGRQPQLPRGIAGWLEGGKSLLVYDHYDIWQLDISGKKPAINLTNGRRNNIRFEIIRKEWEVGSAAFYDSLDRLLLTAVNMENKDNGFYALQLGSQKGPEQLYMGPKVLYLGGLNYGQSFWGRYSKGRKPLKARDTDTWLLIQQSTTEAPNYYVSHRLKDFKALTNFQPHQDYNWLKAELINFQQSDGSKCKGILYKPENFDPSKKYPVIIHYYDQFSMCLNQYPVKDYTASGYINIPWFVSRGYLVFVTDIYFNKGGDGTPGVKETKIPYGEAALNAVEGAASWLSELSYVDSVKMGIAGHSMAGGLTSYILTHSKRFAAVFMGAGATDWISSALQLCLDNGTSRLVNSYYSGPTGSDIWTNNAKYFDNPILHVGSVTSPLLMFHCKIDGAMPFEQAVELFVAMRRMDKKAWLLEYDNGGHSVFGKDARDLTIRVTQFFDHYLKGAPPPIWMTRGIRAQLKQIETGYEYDTTGRQP